MIGPEMRSSSSVPQMIEPPGLSSIFFGRREMVAGDGGGMGEGEPDLAGGRAHGDGEGEVRHGLG